MKVLASPHRRMANNVFFNLLGQGLPFIAAIFAIPLLIKGLGTERFGIFTLVWVVIGYFGLFDLGLGRAMTKLVAERFGGGRENEIPGLFWTAICIVFLSGLAGSLIVFTSSPWLVHYTLKVPLNLQIEALPAFHLLALSIPIVIAISGLTGFLEACHRFGMIGFIRVPMGAFSFAGPLLVLPYSHSLYSLTAILLVGRLIEFVAYFLICISVFPELRSNVKFKVENIKPLLSFGGWVTVTSIVGPIMLYLDRFLISAMISASAVAYFVTPYVVVTKLLIIPSALVGVLFPTFALLLVENRTQAAKMFFRGTKYVFLVMFPFILILVTFAHEGLSFWVGEEFSKNSSTVLQWLVVGVFINGLAQLPVALVQGSGRPDIVAKLHLVELPIYLLVLVWLLKYYGITGAAMAGVGRIFVDTTVLFLCAKNLVPDSAFVNGIILKFVSVAIVFFVFSANLTVIYWKVAFCALAFLIFIIITWRFILEPSERCSLIAFRSKLFVLR